MPVVGLKSMSILTELNAAPPRPTYSDTLRQFPRRTVAQKIGINTTYLSNVLCGHVIPGPALDKKLQALADEVEAERGGRS